MSMTFHIPAAPTKPVREPCLCAQMAPSFCEDSPDWAELREHADSGCYFCRGDGCFTHKVSTAPMLNMANANCRDVTGLLGLGREDGGSISPQDAPAVLRRALRALNVSGVAESIEREGFTEGRVTECGTTASSIRRRLRGLVDVLKYAVEHNQTVVWG